MVDIHSDYVFQCEKKRWRVDLDLSADWVRSEESTYSIDLVTNAYLLDALYSWLNALDLRALNILIILILFLSALFACIL